ncbi:hypothetical protein J0H58_06605 [bacterium]|nr:hypothetical protein [bacterium]
MPVTPAPAAPPAAGGGWWAEARAFGRRMYDGNATFRGLYNGIDAAGHALGQIPLLAYDAGMSAYSQLSGQPVKRYSDYAAGLERARAEGRVAKYFGETTLDVISFGVYHQTQNTIREAREYARTGDPTRLREVSGEWLASAFLLSPLGRARVPGPTPGEVRLDAVMGRDQATRLNARVDRVMAQTRQGLEAADANKPVAPAPPIPRAGGGRWGAPPRTRSPRKPPSGSCSTPG